MRRKLKANLNTSRMAEITKALNQTLTTHPDEISPNNLSIEGFETSRVY